MPGPHHPGSLAMFTTIRRANVRTAQAAIGSLAGGLELAFRAGAITGLLVAGLALLGVTIYFAILTHGLGLAPNDRTVVDSMEDKPSQALRYGRWKSSMWLAIDAVKKRQADVAVSAGNTGALMAMNRS